MNLSRNGLAQFEIQEHKAEFSPDLSPLNTAILAITDLLARIQEVPKMRKYRKWRDILIEQLAADPTAAIGFLQAVMEDYQVFRNPAAVVSAAQAVIESQGGIEEVAKRTTMAPETLSKILSSEKVLHFDTLAAVLNALGCRLSIEPFGAKDQGGFEPWTHTHFHNSRKKRSEPL